ncbi:MAG: serine/threonine protein kinase [Sandaracinaceae bacterium]|nr:serine/threonine protein kinase [Sandaracinaceae bacterium]
MEAGDRGGPSGATQLPDDTLVLSGMTVGAFFAHRYRIDAMLGVGAMGKVFRATDVVTGEEVAIKTLHADKAGKSQVLARFRREAEILRQLAHPGIVQVRDSGTAPDGTDFIVMELLHGRTLRDELAERGPMSPERVLTLLVAMADALSAAHHKAVVHRDLKPDNVYLVDQGEPPIRIVDFGLSLLGSDARMTKTGVMLGTPRYMAPEQIKSARSATARTDIYALGIVVHEMLMGGKSPFPAEDTGQLLGCVLEGRILKLEELRPDLPPLLGEVVRRAMAKDPRDRYATAGAFAEAFAACLGASTGRSQLNEVDLDAIFAAELAELEGAAPLDPIAFDAGGPPPPAMAPAELPQATLMLEAPVFTPSGGIPRAAVDAALANTALANTAPGNTGPDAPQFTPPAGVPRVAVQAALQAATAPPRISMTAPAPSPSPPGSPRFSAPPQAPSVMQTVPAPKTAAAVPSKRKTRWWIFVLAVFAVATCSAGMALGARGCARLAQRDQLQLPGVR